MYICMYICMYIYIYVWPAGACRPSLSRADDARRLRSHAHLTLLLYVWDGGHLSQMPSKVLVCRSLVLVHKIDVQLEKIILRPPDRSPQSHRALSARFVCRYVALRRGAGLFVCLHMPAPRAMTRQRRKHALAHQARNETNAAGGVRACMVW